MMSKAPGIECAWSSRHDVLRCLLICILLTGGDLTGLSLPVLTARLVADQG
jgi:hypothetical protein